MDILYLFCRFIHFCQIYDRDISVISFAIAEKKVSIKYYYSTTHSSFTDIRETLIKRMARLDELFAEQKFDEALTYYTDDFTGLYPGQKIIKDKKGK